MSKEENVYKGLRLDLGTRGEIVGVRISRKQGLGVRKRS
jgi:hypothetical protein